MGTVSHMQALTTPSSTVHYTKFLDILAIIFCFYPMAGYLAENKYGRYKTVVFCLWLLLPSFIFLATYFAIYWPSIFHFPIEINVIAALISAILLAISKVSIIMSCIDYIRCLPSNQLWGTFRKWYQECCRKYLRWNHFP